MEKAVAMGKTVEIKPVAMGQVTMGPIAMGPVEIKQTSPMVTSVKKKVWCADGTCRNIELQNFAIDIEKRFVNNSEAEERFLNPRELAIRLNKLKEYIDDRYVSKDQLRAFANANNLKLM